MLGSTGLPIWATEFDIAINDEDAKAQGYEDLFRLFFAHPSIEGVMMWGFWNKDHWRPAAAIVEGNNFKVSMID
jgi:endo-1,4-beta-xylanase